MAQEYNIMLTSIGTPGDRQIHHYFYHKDHGMMWYCDGMSVAEAGTKYILSEVPIDEIIVLGAANSFNEGEESDPVSLQGWMNFRPDTIEDISEYSFFLYRLSQYINGLDIEGVDIMSSIPAERQRELVDLYRSFCDELSRTVPNFRQDRIFHYVASDKSIYRKMKDMMPSLTREEVMWMKRYMYSSQLNSNFKLRSLVENENLSIHLIPTGGSEDEYTPGRNVRQIVKAILASDAESINVYIDMQGLEQTDGYMILSVLSMLSNDVNSPIHVKEIITSHDFDKYANPIDNSEMRRYKINNLMSGMDAFIRYGKVDEINAYWRETGIENKHVDMLLYAMKRVDEGISFCNTGDLEYGISLLKKVFEDTPKEELSEAESNIINILENSIRRDYGPILDGDKPDELALAKWAVRKKLYQQALTIIEARFPEAFVSRGLVYYAKDEESKMRYLEDVNKFYWGDAPRDRWKYDNPSHYFIKYFGKNSMPRGFGSNKITFTDYRMETLDENNSTGLAQAFSLLNDKRDLLKSVMNGYADLGYLRNSLNHAEAREAGNIDEIDFTAENEAVKEVIDKIDAFLATYEKARQYIEENAPADFAPVEYTPEEFKEYSSAHKIEYDGNKKFGKSGGYSGPKRYDDRKPQEAKPEGEANAAPRDDNRPHTEGNTETRTFGGEHKKPNTFTSTSDGNVTVTKIRQSDGKELRITIRIDEEGEEAK